jgi:hypothetical protein
MSSGTKRKKTKDLGGVGVGAVKRLPSYEEEFAKLEKDVGSECWAGLLDPGVVTSEEVRERSWSKLVQKGDALREKFSWAVPSSQALNICQAFAPLVELGAGKGYWSHLLQSQGVDIIAVD